MNQFNQTQRNKLHCFSNGDEIYLTLVSGKYAHLHKVIFGYFNGNTSSSAVDGSLNTQLGKIHEK